MALLSVLLAGAALFGAAAGQPEPSAAPAAPEGPVSTSGAGGESDAAFRKDVPVARIGIPGEDKALEYVLAQFGTIPYGHTIECAPPFPRHFCMR